MPNISDICEYLDQFAPTRLAEDWDNVGLLAGNRADHVTKIMTCLTITPASVAEAIEQKANLIVSHHPLPFRALKKITTDTIPAKMLWELIRAGVAIYSPHTGFDSAGSGINQMLADRFGLRNTRPLNPIVDDKDGLGSGRIGEAKGTFGEFIQTCKQQLGLDGMHIVGSLDQPVGNVAIACGSGGSFLGKANQANCNTFVTGETTFHTCLEAESTGTNLILLGHYASERFAIEFLAENLQTQFADLEVWASQKESDPLVWV